MTKSHHFTCFSGLCYGLEISGVLDIVSQMLESDSFGCLPVTIYFYENSLFTIIKRKVVLAFEIVEKGEDIYCKKVFEKEWN